MNILSKFDIVVISYCNISTVCSRHMV